jgi:AcrR family transcriptional regulator
MASGSRQGVDSMEESIATPAPLPPADDLRARLIDATEDVMRVNGPLGVRIDEVAQRAGCSRATVYRYVADKDELVREVLVRMARVRSAKIERDLAHVTDPAEAIAEGVLRTVEAIRHEWWYEALEGHGATAAVARIGGGPQAFTALATPLVTPFLARLSASGRLREDITDTEATEWLVVVTVGLLTMETSPERSRSERARFLRQFVAYSLLRPS